MQLVRLRAEGREARARRQPLAVGDEQELIIGRDGDRRRIPACRDEAVDEGNLLAAILRLFHEVAGDVSHHHRIIVGVGDEERIAVGRNRQAARRAAFRRLRIKGSRDDLARTFPEATRRAGGLAGLLQLARLDDVHRVVAGAGHEQAAIRGERQVVRAEADGDITDALMLGDIDDADAPATPVRDVEMLTVASDGHGVRVLPHCHGLFK